MTEQLEISVSFQLQQRLAKIAQLAIAEHAAWLGRNRARDEYRDWLENYNNETGERLDVDIDDVYLEPVDKARLAALRGAKYEAQRKLGVARAATRKAIKREIGNDHN